MSDRVNRFIQFEKDWLYGEWNEQKFLMIIMVPVSLSVMGIAFWNRSLFIGLAVIVLMAIGKIVWSIYHGGESGKSLVLPALFGQTCCTVMIGYGFIKLEKRHNPNR